MDQRRPNQLSTTGAPRWTTFVDPLIEFLHSSTEPTDNNAAACLQQLTASTATSSADCPETTSLWQQVLPSLVNLIGANSEACVQRAACLLLRTASYGSANVANKKSIAAAGGVAAILCQLTAESHNDIAEMLTGLLWNLSSCSELKRGILEEGVASLVHDIIVPFSEVVMSNGLQSIDQLSRTIFSNTCGILRSLSSDGLYARQALRLCESLVESLLVVASSSIADGDVDSSAIEHCTCLLRNVSFACQEIVEPDYLKTRAAQRPSLKEPSVDSDSRSIAVCCLCSCWKPCDPDHPDTVAHRLAHHSGQPPRGMELLWQPEITRIYLPLLSNSTNIVTVEAALGALQNLTACTWQPAADIRGAVRLDKGLPIIINLLLPTEGSQDIVIRTAAICLRNLAADQKNKELIGKYALSNLVALLPGVSHDQSSSNYSNNLNDGGCHSNETLCAVIATLHDLVSGKPQIAKQLLDSGGVHRLINIVQSPSTIFGRKVTLLTSQLLQLLWNFHDLRDEFAKNGWKKSHFVIRQHGAKTNIALVDDEVPRRRIVLQHHPVSVETISIATPNNQSMSPVSPFVCYNSLPFDSSAPDTEIETLSQTENDKSIDDQVPAIDPVRSRPINRVTFDLSPVAFDDVTSFDDDDTSDIISQETSPEPPVAFSNISEELEDECCNKFLQHQLKDVQLSNVDSKSNQSSSRNNARPRRRPARPRVLHPTFNASNHVQITDSWV